MASTFSHFSVLALYWLFPGSFSLVGLALGSQLPDIDVIVSVLRGRKKYGFPHFFSLTGWRLFSLRVWLNETYRLLHNLGAVLFVVVPLGFGLTLLLESLLGLGPRAGMTIAGSVLVGALSHLVLDLPAHRNLRYFTPFEKEKPAPFLLFRNLGLFKRIYPFTPVEHEFGKPAYLMLPMFNYLMVSNLFPFIAAGFVLLVRAL